MQEQNGKSLISELDRLGVRSIGDCIRIVDMVSIGEGAGFVNLFRTADSTNWWQSERELLVAVQQMPDGALKTMSAEEQMKVLRQLAPVCASSDGQDDMPPPPSLHRSLERKLDREFGAAEKILETTLAQFRKAVLAEAPITPQVQALLQANVDDVEFRKDVAVVGKLQAALASTEAQLDEVDQRFTARKEKLLALVTSASPEAGETGESREAKRRIALLRYGDHAGQPGEDVVGQTVDETVGAIGFDGGKPSFDTDSWAGGVVGIALGAAGVTSAVKDLLIAGRLALVRGSRRRALLSWTTAVTRDGGLSEISEALCSPPDASDYRERMVVLCERLDRDARQALSDVDVNVIRRWRPEDGMAGVSGALDQIRATYMDLSSVVERITEARHDIDRKCEYLLPAGLMSYQDNAAIVLARQHEIDQAVAEAVKAVSSLVDNIANTRPLTPVAEPSQAQDFADQACKVFAGRLRALQERSSEHAVQLAR